MKESCALAVRRIFIEKTGRDCWEDCKGGGCIFSAYEAVAIITSKDEPEANQ